MENEFAILLISFFIIALIYSSVGFGGGSSYLAILALLAVDFLLMRSTALLCNIVVVVGGVYIFYKEGKLDIKKTWPLVVSSVPLAYLGGLWPIRQETFFILLGITLVIVSVLLWFQPEKNASFSNKTYDTIAFKVCVGGALGFISGLVGIGGGIFLSPILHFIRWDEAKKISAAASFFILVNSIGGLTGQLQQRASLDWHFIWPLLAAVFVGGQVGSRLGAQKFNPLYVKRITAILILVAGSKILLDNF
ncbi:MAG TPA: sulfite exporter TauE/SafE family protein [Cyclobacteriaceae bacterium]|nr:sulfite exporter TauE/SafE family protein [Cyclobacteriaceae bacterium]